LDRRDREHEFHQVPIQIGVSLFTEHRICGGEGG
jgi:hypothetical protein